MYQNIRINTNSSNQNYWGNGADGSLTVSANTAWDSGISGEMIVKNFVDFTVSPGVTLTIKARKGCLIYVQGNFVNNGTITVQSGYSCDPSAAGVPSTGLRIIRAKTGGTDTLSASDLTGCGSTVINAETQQNAISGNGKIYNIPRTGGSGGVQVASDVGNSGGSGTLCSGGGGSGGGYGGAGTAGTCFSGGSGGGGGYPSYGGNGTANGGAGGGGRGENGYYGGGGAGNPGGSGGGGSGESLLGGLLIFLVKKDFTNAGTIAANGGVGGGSGGGSNGGGKGGCGGGGIILGLYAGTISNSGTIAANGGSGSTNGGVGYSGGDGGTGSVLIEQINK